MQDSNVWCHIRIDPIQSPLLKYAPPSVIRCCKNWVGVRFSSFGTLLLPAVMVVPPLEVSSDVLKRERSLSKSRRASPRSAVQTPRKAEKCGVRQSFSVDSESRLSNVTTL